MDTDLALVLGLILGGMAIPSVLSAYSDRRAPRASAVTVLIAGALILYAVAARPGGYSLAQIPDVFFGVIAQFIP